MLLSLRYHSKLLKISVCVDEAFTLPALSHLTVTTTILFNQQLLIKQLVCNKYGGDWAYEKPADAPIFRIAQAFSGMVYMC